MSDSIERCLMPPKELGRLVLEWNERFRECQEKGHDFQDVLPYNHRTGTGTQRCSYCPAFNERRGTAAEHQDYADIFKLQITI